MKYIKEHDRKGFDEPDVYEVRKIAARLFEVHREEAGFDRERLRALVRDALIGQGHEPHAALIDEAIRGMAGS